MKDTLNEIIHTLSAPQATDVLTIYMPTHHIVSPATTKEDRTRYKNLIRDGISQWEKKIGKDIPKSIRTQLESIDTRDSFWHEMGKSLAIFANTKEVRTAKLPIESDEYVFVGSYFDLSPLHISLPFLDKFYVLALALHEPKLYCADVKGIHEIQIDFPKSPEDALNIDEMFSGSNTIRGLAAPSGNNGTLATHGQGDSNHAGQEERLKYLRIIDHMILKSKDIDHDRPILVAGTQSEATDFKAISNNKYLFDAILEGNFTKDKPNELHALAWDVYETEYIQPKLNHLVETFNEGKNVGKASSEVAEIKEAAKQGRISFLLLGILPRTNDSVDDSNNPERYFLRLSDVYKNHDMSELARRVLEQGGKIIGVEPAKLATATSVAATYRY